MTWQRNHIPGVCAECDTEYLFSKYNREYEKVHLDLTRQILDAGNDKKNVKMLKGGNFVTCKWKDIRVGSVVKVSITASVPIIILLD